MKNETKKSGVELLKQALNELISDPAEKINMNAVAKRAGVNHSLFRKSSYQQIKLEILDAQKIRENELENRSKDEQINTLKTKLRTVSDRLEKQATDLIISAPKTTKKADGALMARLLEMYRFNDLLSAQLAEKHGEKIDETTGEVIKINFQNRK